MTGSRHARRAALPTAGYTRERKLDPDALTVTVPAESGGTEAVLDFSVLPGPRPLLAGRRATPAGKTTFCLGAPPGDSLRRWASSAGLAGDGGPGQVSLRRLRRTVQVLIRREPAQNTARTHEQVTAQGLTDAVGHAREVMQMRMLLDAGADQLTDYTGGPQQAQALAAGMLDTATAACLDYTHSPFSPPGQPCTASFLDYLACRNAVATRRHLPRLAWLHRALDELRGTVGAAIWAQDCETPNIPTRPVHHGCRAIQEMASSASCCSTARYSSRRKPSDSPEPRMSSLTEA